LYKTGIRIELCTVKRRTIQNIDITFKNVNAQFISSYRCIFQILKPSEKKAKYQYGGMNSGRPITPPRGPVKKK